MSHSHPFKLYSALVTATLIVVGACAPKTAPAPAAPPVTVARTAPTIMQTCPSPTDGSSIVVNAVEEAHRALVSNSSTPLPPACVLDAYAKIQGAVPDSINAHALSIAMALVTRGADKRDALNSEITLLARAHRWSDLTKTYQQLEAVDAQPSMAVVKLAIAAAHANNDEASALRILGKNASRADASPAMKSELTVLRQGAALRAAVTEARGMLRQNPKYVAAYPSLLANYGQLGLPDSVAAFARRGASQGASRAQLAPAMDPLVNTMLRHASVYGAAYGWDAQIAGALRADSALSTNSTKFLVAALIAQAIEPQVVDVSSMVTGFAWLPGSQSAASPMRATGCARVAALIRQIDVADAKLKEGGDKYTGGGVSAIASGLSAERTRLSDLLEVCSR